MAVQCPSFRCDCPPLPGFVCVCLCFASTAVTASVLASHDSPLKFTWEADVEGWVQAFLRNLNGDLSWGRSAGGSGKARVISLTFEKCVLASFHPQDKHFSHHSSCQHSLVTQATSQQLSGSQQTASRGRGTCPTRRRWPWVDVVRVPWHF